MTEDQRTTLEAMAEEMMTRWQRTASNESAAAISAYAQCMQALESDRIATVLDFFKADYEKEPQYFKAEYKKEPQKEGPNDVSR